MITLKYALNEYSMAFCINKVILVGNVGKDPDVRHSQDGLKVVSFSVATTESWKDKNTGEKKDKTEWHRVVVFNQGIAEIAEKIVKKGCKVYVEGQLQSRKWVDQDNNERFITEVVITRVSGELVVMSSDRGDFSSVSYDNFGVNVDEHINDDIPF